MTLYLMFFQLRGAAPENWYSDEAKGPNRIGVVFFMGSGRMKK